MKTLLRYYYYLYYKIYHSIKYTSQKLGGEFWTDIKAIIVLDAIMICNILSLLGYYNIFIDRYFKLEKAVFVGIMILVIVINSKLFLPLSKGEKYYNNFDSLPKKEHTKKTLIIIGLIIFIIINFIYMLYLKSQIDWRKYR